MDKGKTSLWPIVVFEFSLGALAIALVWAIERRSVFFWLVDVDAVLMALAASVPMLGFAYVMTHPALFRMAWVKRIYDLITSSFLGRFIKQASYAELAWVSLAAGVGEELFFRGALQYWWGLWGASLFFGLLHALSPAYFAIATLVGLYLGYIYELSQYNVFVPALIHGGYDFVALCFYKTRMEQGFQAESD